MTLYAVDLDYECLLLYLVLLYVYSNLGIGIRRQESSNVFFIYLKSRDARDAVISCCNNRTFTTDQNGGERSFDASFHQGKIGPITYGSLMNNGTGTFRRFEPTLGILFQTPYCILTTLKKQISGFEPRNNSTGSRTHNRNDANGSRTHYRHDANAIAAGPSNQSNNRRVFTGRSINGGGTIRRHDSSHHRNVTDYLAPYSTKRWRPYDPYNP